MDKKILLVEDEENIRKFTRINLEREGFIVLEASSGEEGVEIAEKEKPAVVILDIMLPGIDGYEVCSILRKSIPSTGIIMLTAKTQEDDKIFGLEKGADDYLSKPFNPKELILRIKSLIRRLKTTDDNFIISGPFELDINAKSLKKDGVFIDLTPTELSIVTLFMKNPGRAFSRTELLDKHWGSDYLGETKIVDVNIRRLRSKIEDNPGKPEYLETVWGTGYRWKKD